MTAKEFHLKKRFEAGMSEEDILIEFAQYHLIKALEQIKDNVGVTCNKNYKCIEQMGLGYIACATGCEDKVIDKKALYSVYPIENIK